jgi:hypothetical protein
MRSAKLIVALTVLGLLGLSAISYSQEGEPKEKGKNETTQQKEVYTCPMHAEVTSDKPGKCPKCGMNLVSRDEKAEATRDQQASESSTANEKISQARSLLAEAKRELTEEGKYSCCIKDPCDRCALDHQSCPCADEVKAGKSVCPDCYAGWQRGDGIVPGVKAEKVKGSFHSHKH